MSKAELEELIQFHQKMAKLNRGKEEAAKKRRLFHELTVAGLKNTAEK